MSLREYKKKRNFSRTSEPTPAGKRSKSAAGTRRFVIQKHDATRLHYDFRLELGGVLVSWAVPKGLPMKKGEKRLAVKVEDHPVSYMLFEGVIPKGEYGGGTVQVWDTGTFKPLTRAPIKEIEGGKLHVMLEGEKLKGEWYLVRLKDGDDQWLIIKGSENHPRLAAKVADRSALSGRTIKEIAKAPEKIHHSNKQAKTTTTKKRVAQKQFNESSFIEPMKAKLVDEVPNGDWIYEVKFDGFRSLAFKNGRSLHLISRTRNDLTEKFPEIAEALQNISSSKIILDGEIVALDKKGRSSFQLLQAYDLGQEKPPLCYYVFDLLSLNGKKLTRLPLEERKEKLKALLPEDDSIIRYSSSLSGNANTLLKKVSKLGLEGLIGKKSRSTYESGKRSGSWIKLKIVNEQEFVIGGYTEPAGSRKHFGALLVGVREGGKWIYAGKVGTGFDAALLRELHKTMQTHISKKCPFDNLPEERTGRYGQGITASVMKKCHWIKPRLVCQIKFAEWTRDGRLRQPVFLGLRKDKKPAQVVREKASHH